MYTAYHGADKLGATQTIINTQVADGTSLVVLVRSARPKRAQRDGIRESWAQNASRNVFFVVANQTCVIPEQLRAEYWRCEPGKRYDASQAAMHRRTAALLDARVADESSRHADMVLVDHVDAHRSSNAWLKQAYAWALRHTDARWLVKTDDDVYVHVHALARWVRYLPDAWTLLGLLGPPGPIATRGKTSETAQVAARYRTYPPWPRGSSGYVVSRDIAEHVSRLGDDAPSFHGEDVSMGLWLSAVDDPGRVRWIHAGWEFSNSRACRDQSRLVTGHGLLPSRLHMCATSPCLSASHPVGKGSGCGPRRLRPLEARAPLPRCAISPLGLFVTRGAARGGPAAAAHDRDAPCEFRLLGHEGAGDGSGWRLLVDTTSPGTSHTSRTSPPAAAADAAATTRHERKPKKGEEMHARKHKQRRRTSLG